MVIFLDWLILSMGHGLIIPHVGMKFVYQPATFFVNHDLLPGKHTIHDAYTIKDCIICTYDLISSSL